MLSKGGGSFDMNPHESVQHSMRDRAWVSQVHTGQDHRLQAIENTMEELLCSVPGSAAGGGVA